MHIDPDAPESPPGDANAPHSVSPAHDAAAAEQGGAAAEDAAEQGGDAAAEQGGDAAEDAAEQGGDAAEDAAEQGGDAAAEPDAPEQPDAEEDDHVEGIEAQAERLPSDSTRRVVGVVVLLNGNVSPALARAVLASAGASEEDVAAALAAAQAEAPAGSAAHAVGPWEVPEGAGPVLLTGYHERLRGQDLILAAAGTPAEPFALWLAAHEPAGERAHRLSVDVVAWLPSAAELRAWLDATAAVARAEVAGRRRHALERARWLGRAARNNDDLALAAAALNLAGAPEAERAAAAVKGRRAAALVASWEARLKASWGEAQPPPAAPAPPAEAPQEGRPARKPRRKPAKPAKPSAKRPAKAR